MFFPSPRSFLISLNSFLDHSFETKRFFSMDNQSATKMPKPFDTEETPSASAQQKQFELREDDRLKQEEDYRQGFVFVFLNFNVEFFLLL